MVLFTIKSPFHLFIPALSVPSPKTVIAAFHIHVRELKTDKTASPWMTLSRLERSEHCSTSGHLKQTNVSQSPCGLAHSCYIVSTWWTELHVAVETCAARVHNIPLWMKSRRASADICCTGKNTGAASLSRLVLSWPLTSVCYIWLPLTSLSVLLSFKMRNIEEILAILSRFSCIFLMWYFLTFILSNSVDFTWSCIHSSSELLPKHTGSPSSSFNFIGNQKKKKYIIYHKSNRCWIHI